MPKTVYLTLTFLLILLFTSAFRALSISVECNPKVIGFGGTTTITVTSDTNGNGYIKVTAPGGSSQQVTISATAGVPLSKVYPTDFGGNTQASGEYEVEVYLNSGKGGRATFYVGFTVVAPEYPFGTITALLLCLGTMGIIKMKRSAIPIANMNH